MNLLDKYIEKKVGDRLIPDFRSGDTLAIQVKIVEGASERVQKFEGVCIAKRNRGIGSSFLVRKISYGIGVEKKFMLYSPRVVSIEVVRKGKVRRAKPYYIRNLRGKAARIRERV